MTYQEHALLMPCDSDTLVGVLSQPQTPRAVGVVIVVGGPQYRVGSHRQFVLLARRLAETGYPALRFDYRGMGDSEGEPRSFEAVDHDIATAINALQKACPGVRRVVLWGLCDGASAALLYCGARPDPRVAGLCLLNPWVRSDATLARTHLKHHYTARLFQADFWKKVLRGQFNPLQSLAGLWHSLWASRRRGDGGGAQVAFQQRMALSLRAFPGGVLLLLSGADYTAKEFLETAQSDSQWSGLLQRPQLLRVDVPGADHTFSRQEWQAQAERAVVEWMESITP